LNKSSVTDGSNQLIVKTTDHLVMSSFQKTEFITTSG